MRDFLATGFVLRRYNQAETNRILIFFSQQQGKLKLMAKGVRKVGSRRAGHLEPFVLTRLHLHRGRTFDIVTTAEAQKVYDLDFSNLEQISLGYLFLEMVDKTAVEHQKNQAIFELLQESFGWLSSRDDSKLLRIYFCVKLLQALGNQPNLDVQQGQKHYLSYDDGRVLATKPAGPAGEISIEVIKLWRLVYSHNFSVVKRVSVDSKQLDLAQNLLDKYFQYHFGLSFRSSSILKQ
ncbi:DNA repair protein RecO [Candidatus Saccharibacteria bacterium]|nr:DNA repair protein RecO [Candidatus Saccharibacteria bacterium]